MTSSSASTSTPATTIPLPPPGPSASSSKAASSSSDSSSSKHITEIVQEQLVDLRKALTSHTPPPPQDVVGSLDPIMGSANTAVSEQRERARFLATTEARANGLAEQLKKLQTDLDRTNNEKSELEKRLSEAQQSKSNIEKELSAANERVTHAETALNETRKHHVTANSASDLKIVELTKEVAEAKAAVKEKADLLEGATKSITDLQGEVQRLQEQLSAAKQRLKNLEGACPDCPILKKANRDFEERITTLTINNALLTKEIETQKNAVETREKELAASESLLKETNQRYAEAARQTAGQLFSQQERIEELEGDNNALQSRVDLLALSVYRGKIFYAHVENSRSNLAIASCIAIVLLGAIGLLYQHGIIPKPYFSGAMMGIPPSLLLITADLMTSLPQVPRHRPAPVPASSGVGILPELPRSAQAVAVDISIHPNPSTRSASVSASTSTISTGNR